MIFIVLLLTAAALAVLSGWDWESQSLSQLPAAIQNNLLNPDYTLTLDFSKRTLIAAVVILIAVTLILNRIAQWWRRRQLPDFLRDL